MLFLFQQLLQSAKKGNNPEPQASKAKTVD